MKPSSSSMGRLLTDRRSSRGVKRSRRHRQGRSARRHPRLRRRQRRMPTPDAKIARLHAFVAGTVVDRGARPAAPCLTRREPRHINGRDLGAVAQLGERCNRTAEVRSSILLGSTMLPPSQLKIRRFWEAWCLGARSGRADRGSAVLLAGRSKSIGVSIVRETLPSRYRIKAPGE